MWRWFKRADGLPFCFAGIWRPWTGDRGTRKAPKAGQVWCIPGFKMTGKLLDATLKSTAIAKANPRRRPEKKTSANTCAKTSRRKLS